MTIHQPIDILSPDGDAKAIDSLVRALHNLRHWSAAAASRQTFDTDLGRRLQATASNLRDIAWAESLLAAYALFEIDGIYEAWTEAAGRDGG